jgi:hypothetical protein
MDYISFYVDKKGVRYGVDLATGKKTRLSEDAAEQDEQAADDAAPVETITQDEG